MESCPKEILEKIFTYCNHRELLNLTVTCKQFNDIISSNRQFMKKFQIEVKYNTDDAKNWNGTRKYSRLFMNKMHREIPKIIEATRNDLTELGILFVQIDGMFLKKILLDCPKLTKLAIANTTCTYTDECFSEPLPRLMLNELRCSSDRKVLNMLMKSQTKMYENLCENVFPGELSVLKKFLKNQQHLEELQLYSFNNDCAIFHDETLNDVDFRLKQFRVNGFGNFNGNNFKKFLENHRKSLAHMEIGQVFPTDCPVVRMYQIQVVNSIKDFCNLKSLFLRRIFLNFEPLPYVEKLKLHQMSLGGANLNCSEKFPNVKKLSISECESVMEIINLPKLESLEIEEIKILEELEISLSVKHLRLHRVVLNLGFNYDFDNGQIETLKVEYCTEADWLVDFLNGLNKRLKLLDIFKISLRNNESFASVFDEDPSLKEKAEKIIFVDI